MNRIEQVGKLLYDSIPLHGLEEDERYQELAQEIDKLYSTDAERIYPCDKCGKLRSKAEGGTCFSLCDECWEKHYHFKKGDSTTPDLMLSPEEIGQVVTKYSDAGRHSFIYTGIAKTQLAKFQPIIEENKRLKEEVKSKFPKPFSFCQDCIEFQEESKQ